MLVTMAEPFKNLVNTALVDDIAHHLHRLWPGFDAATFRALAASGLDGLALKARVQHIAAALDACLPADLHQALDLLEASLGPAGDPLSQGDDLGQLRSSAQGLAGWAVWPLTELVVRRALAQPDKPANRLQAREPGVLGLMPSISSSLAYTGIDTAAAARGLRALHAMTQRASAEFALRPFIVAHPELAQATLARWASDPSAHVRRLASEGSRPRLPWGLRLQALVADPSPSLPLLRRLQDDPSAYVRRSVANHLNDIAKDHPALVAQWLAEHLPGAPPARQALLRHASRTLVKQGDAAVLAAWGVAQAFAGQASWSLAPPALRIGDTLALSLALDSSADVPQRLVIDYAVHHVKADGRSSAKVFKGWVLTLAPGEKRLLQRRHSFKPVTTRQLRPGWHVLDLRINGAVLAQAGVMLQAAAG